MYHVFSLFRFFQDLFQGPPGISLCVSPWKSGQGRPPRKQEASHCFTRESRADVAVPSAERRSCPLECRFSAQQQPTYPFGMVRYSVADLGDRREDGRSVAATCTAETILFSGPLF